MKCWIWVVLSRRPLAHKTNIATNDSFGVRGIEGIGDRGGLKGVTLTVGSIVNDLFELRDHFVHGKWIPQQFQSKPGRVSIGGAPMAYADTLREAASFILRKSILNFLAGLPSSEEIK